MKVISVPDDLISVMVNRTSRASAETVLKVLVCVSGSTFAAFSRATASAEDEGVSTLEVLADRDAVEDLLCTAVFVLSVGALPFGIIITTRAMIAAATAPPIISIFLFLSGFTGIAAVSGPLPDEAVVAGISGARAASFASGRSSFFLGLSFTGMGFAPMFSTA
jgi:hypothetical protein